MPYFVFFFKQKTAYEMRISDWSSDVCSSDLLREELLNCRQALQRIGRNVNQIARAANKMALADNAAEIAGELHKVNDLRAAIGAAVEGIGAATKAALVYWEVPGERL